MVVRVKNEWQAEWIIFSGNGVIMSRKIIGVFGAGNVTESDEEYQLALKVGGQLAREGIAVLTGGLGGVMTAASKGAKEAGGMTILTHTKKDQVKRRQAAQLTVELERPLIRPQFRRYSMKNDSFSINM